MIHKNCGGELQIHTMHKNRLVIERGIYSSDHPAISRYSGYLVDKLMRCSKCNLIGIEHGRKH
jgi:hypothetical protein